MGILYLTYIRLVLLSAGVPAIFLKARVNLPLKQLIKETYKQLKPHLNVAQQ